MERYKRDWSWSMQPNTDRVWNPKGRPPMWTKSSPPRACERCLGLVFWLALISHLTHLQLKGPPLSLHVLPSVWTLCPDQTQLPGLLLSLLLKLPSNGGREGKEKKNIIPFNLFAQFHNVQFSNLSDPLSFSLGFLFPLIYFPRKERRESKSDKRQ